MHRCISNEAILYKHRKTFVAHQSQRYDYYYKSQATIFVSTRLSRIFTLLAMRKMCRSKRRLWVFSASSPNQISCSSHRSIGCYCCCYCCCFFVLNSPNRFRIIVIIFIDVFVVNCILCSKKVSTLPCPNR